MKTVSILTPTTIKRKLFIKLCAKMIIKQDYKKIIEWIIIDGTREEDSDLEITINEMKKMKNIPNIVFIKQDKNRNNRVGALRNEINKIAKGDILVNFDDDDYYPEKRVSHAVSKLNSSKKQLGLCSPLLMYDHDFKDLYQFISFGENHGCGGTMAYTKEYALNNTFADDKEFAEESHFTNKFTTPAVQLDSKHTIVCISHNANTYNKKKEIVWDNLNLDDKSEQKTLFKVSNGIKSFCKDKSLFKEYSKFLELESTTKYDIVYYCGRNTHLDVTNNNCCQPIHSIIKLTEQWVKNGYQVAVYGNIDEDIIVNGVEFLRYSRFRISVNYNTLILWGLSGLKLLDMIKINAKNLIVEYIKNDELLLNNLDYINYIIYKNTQQYQNSLINIDKYRIKQMIETKKILIPNGININRIVNKNINRYKYRFYYNNHYGDGLDKLLIYFFPVLKKHFPETEFHIYNGMDNNFNEKYKNMLLQLFEQDGVYEYGSVPLEILQMEQLKSNFHLYYTNNLNIIDNISIKESSLNGCIPILSQLSELSGIHLPGNPDDVNDMIQAAETLVTMIKNDEKIKEIRQEIVSNKQLYSWEDTANQWMEHLQLKSIHSILSK